MFRYRLQLRRWAAAVLLLWLFGVGAGVANACLARPLAQAVGQIAIHASDEGSTHQEAAAPELGHHPGSGQPSADEGALGQPGNAAKANCLDFCDKASVSIPPLKSTLDDVQGHALSLSTIAVVLPAPAFVPVQVLVPRRDGDWAPPIPIAFLRLTL